MTINEQLNQQRNTPGFASKTAEEQYNAQKGTILSGLMGNSNFTALPREEQLIAFKNSLKKGVSYVYENPQMGNMVSQTVNRILAGDTETAKVASNYSLGSYTHEKMPMVFRLASRIGTLIWAGPPGRMPSSIPISRTNGSGIRK